MILINPPRLVETRSGKSVANTSVAARLFQLIPKLNANIMSEIERILDNKPSRPPMISTLALR